MKDRKALNEKDKDGKTEKDIEWERQRLNGGEGAREIYLEMDSMQLSQSAEGTILDGYIDR